MFEDDISIHKKITACPYCKGVDIVKRGMRKKKYEEVQVYFCKKCGKKFTPGVTKHKTYPLRIILEAMTWYNRLHTLEEAAKKVSEQYGLKVAAQTLKNWLVDFASYLPFARLREFIGRKYEKKDMIEEAMLFHGQIYPFKYHRAKLDLILQEDFKHYKFTPLREFLELVKAECPHQMFKNSQKRASEYRNVFNLGSTMVVPKANAATRIANFVIQAVANNKLRHEVLQEFMLVNDSVTVATEVPVLLDHNDIIHYKNELNFDVPVSLEEEEVITGHIDIVQVRNGLIHLIDYKPSARKEKPIEQLTLYALALSRLTTLRLFHFKCAWFDEEDYFEFFPLHVVYKKKKKKMRR